MPKLLLADDSVTIRKVVELTFADEGIEVIAAADGDAAMQKFVESQPDIVLVDVEMPGQNGYKICEMIKQDAATRHIPVVLLVGSFEPFDQTEAERVGADGFLTKPFHSIRELVTRVRELLQPEPLLVPSGPDTDDIEHLYQSSFSETAPGDQAERDQDPFRDTSFDDEMVETVQPAASYLDTPFSQSSVTTGTPQPSIGSAGPQAETDVDAGYDQQDAATDDSRADTEEIRSPFAEHAISQVDAAASGANGSVMISDETVNEIAKRVIDKLSDRVIREIAQEAVPRITEKLIREALEEEKKS